MIFILVDKKRIIFLLTPAGACGHFLKGKSPPRGGLLCLTAEGIVMNRDVKLAKFLSKVLDLNEDLKDLSEMYSVPEFYEIATTMEELARITWVLVDEEANHQLILFNKRIRDEI